MNIEWFIVFIVIIFQFGIFFYARTQTSRLESAVPEKSFCSLIKLSIPLVDLATLSADKLLSKSRQYEISANENLDAQNIIAYKLNLISSNRTDFRAKKDDASEICDSINKYLIKNATSTIDFNALRGIVERKIDAILEEINPIIPVPLYVGLFATIFGIAISLFLFKPKSGQASEDLINTVVSGVSVVMIASAAGLFLTALNSALFLNRSKKICEEKKGEFYLFLQTELLPKTNKTDFASEFREILKGFRSDFREILNDSRSSLVGFQNALMDFQRALIQVEMPKLSQTFASAFQETLREFSQAFSKLDKLSEFNVKSEELTRAYGEVIKSQSKLMDSIKEIKVTEIAEQSVASAKIIYDSISPLAQIFASERLSGLASDLAVLTQKIVSLNESINKLNGEIVQSHQNILQLANTTATINDEISKIISTTLPEAIRKAVADIDFATQDLLRELREHIAKEYQNHVNKAFADLAFSVKDISDDVSEHIRQYNQEIARVANEEIQILKQSTPTVINGIGNLTHLGKLPQLEEKVSKISQALEKLPSLNSLSDNISKNVSTLEKIKDALSGLNESVSKSASALEKISERRSLKSFFSNIVSAQRAFEAFFLNLLRRR